MKTFTNATNYGGTMMETVEREFKRSKDICIASGYISNDVVVNFEPDIYRIVESGGSFKLLVGMAFYEGLTAKKHTLLENVERRLSSYNNGSGIFVSYGRKFHGKVYNFRDDEKSTTYIGSSNFSRSGLSENLECTTLINDPQTLDELNKYIEYLFSKDNAVSVLKAEIAVLGTDSYKQRVSLNTLDDLERYDPRSIDTNTCTSFEFDLSRIAEHEKSSLNVYFGKGRLARSTGKIAPRPWYEVELVAPKAVNQQPDYPRGDFIAYTDDGYIIPMKTSGDYKKNIRSRHNLKILGQWIKGRLQNSGALIPLTPVTQDTLDQYGSSKIVFYKMSEGRYFLKF